MHTDNTKIVSWRFLDEYVLGPISRHEDVEEGERPELKFPGLDGKNAVEVKERVICPFVVPWIRSLDETTQRIIKDSFRYCLNAPMQDFYGVEFFKRLFVVTVPDFEGPNPIRRFFI